MNRLFLYILLCFSISALIFAEVSDNYVYDVENAPSEEYSIEDVQRLPEVEKQAKHHYIHPRLKCVLEAPVSWNMDATSKNYKVMFVPEGEQDDIFVGLVAYIAREEVTANAVYLRRSGSKWDRWNLLGRRVLDEKDNFLIGTDESIHAVYRKKKMDDKLRISETFVAENLYIKNDTQVFIVTAKATKAKWFQYKDGIKEIMKSFYISE